VKRADGRNAMKTISELYDEYMALGNPHWNSPDGKKQTEIFRQMVRIDKNDPNRKADRYQNGARL